MTQWLRQLIWLLAGAAVLEQLLPRGGMGRAGRLALGLALIYSALSALGFLQLPAAMDGTPAGIWEKGSAYEPAVYEAQVTRAWQALEANSDEQ